MQNDTLRNVAWRSRFGHSGGSPRARLARRLLEEFLSATPEDAPAVWSKLSEVAPMLEPEDRSRLAAWFAENKDSLRSAGMAEQRRRDTERVVAEAYIASAGRALAASGHPDYQDLLT